MWYGLSVFLLFARLWPPHSKLSVTHFPSGLDNGDKQSMRVQLHLSEGSAVALLILSKKCVLVFLTLLHGCSLFLRLSFGESN